jgi:hypothetical protein
MLDWEDGQEFKKDCITALKVYKEDLLKKKSGFGLGSQWTYKLVSLFLMCEHFKSFSKRRNISPLPVDNDESAQQTAATETPQPKPKKPKKSLPRLR